MAATLTIAVPSKGRLKEAPMLSSSGPVSACARPGTSAAIAA